MKRNIRNASAKLACVILLGVALAPQATQAAPTAPTAVVTIDGSTTLYPISNVSSYQYTADTIQVVGFTGSGHGQTSVMNNYVNVGASSSSCSAANAFKPTPDSFTTAAYVNSGSPSTLNCGQLTNNVIGQDALAIVVNPAKSCVTSITKAQIQGVWQGTITNWNGLNPACASAPITPRSRITTSGTFASFISLAGVNATLEASTIAATGKPRLQGNSQTQQEIQANVNDIGYESLAYVGDLRTVPLDCTTWPFTCPSGSPSAPNRANVIANSYPMARLLRMFTATPPNAPTANYITFIQSPRGQAIVANTGYVPVGPTLCNADVDGNGVVNISDVSILGGSFGQSGPADPNDPEFPNVRGFTRGDVNFDAIVNVQDIATLGSSWPPNVCLPN